MKGISNRGGCKCKQHEFSLKPLSKDVHYLRKVDVSLCECDKIKGKKKMFKIRQQSTSGHPVFNRDGNYATPAFIIQSQKEHFEQNRHIYLKDHVRKLRQYDEISEDLYFPAPRSSHDYCNVCCCSYDNYIEHITSDSHHKQIKKSKFNSHILEVEQMFQNNEGENFMKRSVPSGSTEIDEDSSWGMFGYKKLKTESKTEVPSENNRQLLIGETLMKEYQTYCHLNNMLILQHQQQNMMEKRNERKDNLHYLSNPYQQFYDQQEMMRSQLQLIEFYRQCCYWQSFCQLTQQQQQYPYNQFSMRPFLGNPFYATSLSMPQPNNISSNLQDQYHPSYMQYIQSISAVQ